ncbi:MAG TPA: 2Fe-2S iron-sulfur cluster-binding protein [Burkholderiaceae bacterium]|nr:2Fe-2S iron-sulfur cluster-binding protein [Burkholderiaceae bacterium]
MSRKLSRRSFLLGSALTTAGATMINATPSFAAAPSEREVPQSVGPGEVVIDLHVNGEVHRLTVEPRMTLAEALRGPLGLTGTKIGCDRGACSACTVWLDAKPVCSCMLLAVEVGSQKVTTIEGLAHGEKLHPVQAAFVEHDALQCGYCTPGMVMSCAALLERNANPTAAQVQSAISGHACRCGTYPHAIAATLAAAKVRRG